MSIRITAYPTRHTWTNTPMFRAQMRQAELLRQIPKPPYVFRFRLGDRPHILLNPREVRIIWRECKNWLLGYRPIDRQVISSGKSRPLFQ